MKVGFIGTGRIAVTLANTFAQVQGVELYAVGSRTLEKAEAFAKEHGFAKAYGSYAELAADAEVELVYIATPHSNHYDDMKLCIENKKPVLCEKAFTMNSKQAKEIAELAKQQGVFVTEAIWTRYMPSRQIINEVLESGIIGKVSTLTANLSYVIADKPRIVTPELAGGALLDVGVYGLNFAFMHFGTEIERMESSVQMTDTGVDGQETITLFYKDGRMAVLTHGIYAQSDRKGIFYGDKGYAVVENINNPQSISVFDTEDKLLKKIDMPKQISGYEYQIVESMDAIQKGKIESDSMPLADSVYVMEMMDALRQQWGLVYPQEK